MEICPISNKPMRKVFNHRVLGKYDIDYWYSDESGLLKTDTPYWLEEAYQDAIAATDTGLVSRNIGNAKWLTPILANHFSSDGKFVDVSGGYGLLTRLLRDQGFDCYTSDPYCTNIFAQTFEPSDNFHATAMFAFEVLEHLPDPIAFLTETFEKYRCKTLLFSTLTFENTIPGTDWWYYSFETGQHISFYQPRTLALIAQKLGTHYYQIGKEFHFFSEQALSKFELMKIKNKRFRKLGEKAALKKLKGKSKTEQDHEKMKAMLSND